LHDGVHEARQDAPSAVSALFLDALGTLVALEPPAPRLREQLEEQFGAHVTTDQAQRAISAEISYYRAHLQLARDDESLAQLRRECAGVLRDALPTTPTLVEVSAEQMVPVLLASLEFSLFADARPALQAARARGLALVVVSNWDVSLHEVLGRLGIDSLVDGIVTSAEVGARKPSPEVFRRALELAGADPADAVHVGDSLKEDVVGARAAGIEPILLVRGQRPGPAGVRVIGSLRELDQGP
jgi:putative hydrolase of the HAD superfamily